jgi:hypothetical protein
MRKLGMIFCVAIIAMNYGFSQDFKLPSKTTFDSQQDYDNAEPTIINCINYLENQPVDDTSRQRKQINAYLIAWASGTDKISIGLRGYTNKYFKKYPNLMVIFIGGWVKYSLENNYEKDELRGNVNGLLSIINVYQKSNGIKADDEIIDLIKIYESGDLEKFVSNQISK